MSAALAERLPPGTLVVPIRARISIEALLHWAFAPGRTGGTAWQVNPALSLDKGLTYRPKRRPRVTWLLAEACAGMRVSSGVGMKISALSDDDAALVGSAVNALPLRLAERVRLHARGKSRPDWMDTEKRLERILNPNGKPVIAYSNNRYKKAQYCPLQIVFDRRLTEASKQRWMEWRDALVTLSAHLDDGLARWTINDYLPPKEPWK